MKKRNPFQLYSGITASKKDAALDWEESAVDATSSIEGFMESDQDAPKFRWLVVLVCCAVLIFAARLGFLQLMQGERFRALAEGNRVRNRVLLAPRGHIIDTHGKTIVQNTASFRLVVIPLDLPAEGLAEEIRLLAEVLQLDAREIEEVVRKVDRKSFEPVTVRDDLSQDQSILFATKAREFVGFQVLSVPIREYLSPEAFSHVIGYTGPVSEDDLARLKSEGYGPQDVLGKSGIELAYEQFIRGVNGYDQIEVDAAGRVVKVLGKIEPKPGSILELNIDKELQEVLYQAFRDKGAAKGAAVALNPKTGQVLALVSVPGFNGNLFAHGITSGEYQALLQDKQLPLFNRAIQGTYPPGSTVKPVIALAALQEGIATENTVVVDRGVLVIPNQFNPSISYNFYGWKRTGLGPMDVRSAIAQSSDIYFYAVSGGHAATPIKQGLGADRIAEYYRKFGVGSPTGIDIQGEKAGVVADPAWKASYFKGDAIMSKWYLGDTYHIGIGQGDMLVTPLQVALWTAAIANDGVGMRPQLLKKVTDQFGKVVYEYHPQEIVSGVGDSRHIEVVQEGMRQTVTDGSGRRLSTLPITSAGKTGTSQFDGSDPSRTHAWFTAYAPYEDPQIVITVLVEAGGGGDVVAVPIARDALDWWAKNRR